MRWLDIKGLNTKDLEELLGAVQCHMMALQIIKRDILEILANRSKEVLQETA